MDTARLHRHRLDPDGRREPRAEPRDLDARMNENDAWRTRTSSRLDTLATDIAALAARLNGTASMKFTLKLAADIARVKEKLNLPDNYTVMGCRSLPDQRRNRHARHVEPGLHRQGRGGRRAFPNAAERDSQIRLVEPARPGGDQPSELRAAGLRSRCRGSKCSATTARLSISQYQYQTINWELCTKTRTRIRWGTPIVCLLPTACGGSRHPAGLA